MRAKAIKQIVAAAIIAGFCTLVMRATSAEQTTTGAMASINYLVGTWHCVGGGPAEDDT